MAGSQAGFRYLVSNRFKLNFLFTQSSICFQLPIDSPLPPFDLLREVLQTKVKPNELRSNMDAPPLRLSEVFQEILNKCKQNYVLILTTSYKLCSFRRSCLNTYICSRSHLVTNADYKLSDVPIEGRIPLNG